MSEPYPRPSLFRAMAEGGARHEANATLDRVVERSNDSGGTRTLVGYSYGSVMAAQAALRLSDAGERVDTLVLVGTPMSPDSELYRSLLDNENIGVVVRIDIAGDPFSAGIDPVRAPLEMDRHFHFIENDRGQQDWLADVVAKSVSGAEACRPDCPREIVLRVDPTSQESYESPNQPQDTETPNGTTETSDDRDGR